MRDNGKAGNHFVFYILEFYVLLAHFGYRRRDGNRFGIIFTSTSTSRSVGDVVGSENEIQFEIDGERGN